ncbi:MAG: AraC family transcriptional regulator [Eubacteriales bacterium]|nr:AraC family transcriptional regulator [Eubacteriales bacterium]
MSNSNDGREIEILKEYLPLSRWSPELERVSLYSSETMMPRHKKGDRTMPRPVYKYELQIFTKAGGVAIIDGKEYPAARGSIRFHRPGQIVATELDYECYSCVFSMAMHDNNASQPAEKNAAAMHDAAEMHRRFDPYYMNEYLDIIPSFLSAALPEEYYALFEEMINYRVNPVKQSPIMTKACIMKLLGLLYAESARRGDFGKISVNASEAVASAIMFMKNEYAKKISLKEISKAANLSPTYFHRIFTEMMSVTPLKYLTRVRIEKARILLTTTGLSTAEIAAECGFEDLSYFTAVFGNYAGQTPVKFRKLKRQESIRDV